MIVDPVQAFATGTIPLATSSIAPLPTINPTLPTTQEASDTGKRTLWYVPYNPPTSPKSCTIWRNRAVSAERLVSNFHKPRNMMLSLQQFHDTSYFKLSEHLYMIMADIISGLSSWSCSSPPSSSPAWAGTYRS